MVSLLFVITLDFCMLHAHPFAIYTDYAVDEVVVDVLVVLTETFFCTRQSCAWVIS